MTDSGIEKPNCFTRPQRKLSAQKVLAVIQFLLNKKGDVYVGGQTDQRTRQNADNATSGRDGQA